MNRPLYPPANPLTESVANTHGENHLLFWERRLVGATFVYVLRADAGTPIKVGIANDVIARVASLQTGNPYRLRILHAVPGDHALERAWHHRLKRDRTYGEWFLGPSVDGFLAYVGDLADRMVAAHKEGSTKAPSYYDFDRSLKPRKTRRAKPVGPWPSVTRWVEPDPVVPPDEAQRMRDSVRGCSVSVYAGPANSLIRQKVAPRSTTQY